MGSETVILKVKLAPNAPEVASAISGEAVRELAYLVAATGGRWSGGPTRWAPTWYGARGAAKTLAWDAQVSSGTTRFTRPWEIVMWQPTAGVSRIDFPDSACGKQGQAEAEEAVRHLNASATADPDRIIPDGLAPLWLPKLLSAIGFSRDSIVPTIKHAITAQLRAVMAATRQRSVHVTRLWQRVGVPISSIANAAEPSQSTGTRQCEVCNAEACSLNVIDASAGTAERKIVDLVVKERLQALSERLAGDDVRKRVERILRRAVQGGVHACFKCSAPVVIQRHAQRASDSRKSEAAAAAAAAAAAPRAAPHGPPPGAGMVASSRPQRERGHGVERFEPYDREAAELRAAMLKKEEDKASRTAITSELRAIGLGTPPASLVLQRAPTRRSHQFGAAGRGAHKLTGRVFDEGDRQLMVEDVAPSAQKAGAPTVAYVVDVAVRIRAAGRLDVQCEERELHTVRAALQRELTSGSGSDSESEPDPPGPVSAATSSDHGLV